MKLTIEKALEIIKRWGEETEDIDDEDFSEAVQLGVEALRRVKAKRLHFEVDIDQLLTGEAKD